MLWQNSINHIQSNHYLGDIMDEELAKILWEEIKSAGDKLKGKLPDSPRHPQGRNPYAHIAICIKSHFRVSYKDIPDDQYEEVITFIEHLVKNPK